MGWLDAFRRRKLQAPSDSSLSPSDALTIKMADLCQQLPDNYWPEFDIVPLAHRPVFDYLKRCWAGQASDPAFENKSLSTDFRMKGFNLSALFYRIAVERDVPRERVWKFLSPEVPGADDSVATMFRKIMVLADSGFDEDLYLCALAAGVAVDPRQIQYNKVRILEHADKVEMVVKMARAFDSLKELGLHDAIDVTSGEVAEDPGWRR